MAYSRWGKDSVWYVFGTDSTSLYSDTSCKEMQRLVIHHCNSDMIVVTYDELVNTNVLKEIKEKTNCSDAELRQLEESVKEFIKETDEEFKEGNI